MRLSTWASSSKLLINSLIAGVVMLSSLLVSAPALAADTYTVCSPPTTCDYLNLQDAVNGVTAGSIISVREDLATTNQVTVTKSLTIEGNGHTLTSTRNNNPLNNSNNSAIGITGTDSVTVRNLTIDGSTSVNMHGVNIYVSTNVQLDGLTINSNDRYAVVVNGSSVTINNHVSNSNGWGGINVDKGVGVTSANSLTMNGDSYHSGEFPVLYIQDSTATFTDNTYQYSPIIPGVYTVSAPVPACEATNTSFDTFNTGSVDGQHGWSSAGSVDQEIVNNTYGYASFGCRSLRVSNSYTSDGFANQLFSYATANEAGETAATNNGQSAGTRQSHFEAQFDVATVTSSQQPGLAMTISPDRGDGSRMSFLRLEDQADGIHVIFADTPSTTLVGGHIEFPETDIATLARGSAHTIRFAIDFVAGPSNDVVKIYVNNVLKHTGTSWENYYQHDPEAATEPTTRTVDSLIFRSKGTPSATDGNGFLFDNVLLSTSTPTPPVDTGTGTGSGNGSGNPTPTVTVSSTQTTVSTGDGQGGDNSGNTEDEGEVLGADANILSTSTNDANDNKDVKGVTDEDKKVQESSNFLGLGWWWIPLIVAAILLFLAWLRRRNQDTTA